MCRGTCIVAQTNTIWLPYIHHGTQVAAPTDLNTNKSSVWCCVRSKGLGWQSYQSLQLMNTEYAADTVCQISCLHSNPVRWKLPSLWKRRRFNSMLYIWDDKRVFSLDFKRVEKEGMEKEWKVNLLCEWEDHYLLHESMRKKRKIVPGGWKKGSHKNKAWQLELDSGEFEKPGRHWKWRWRQQWIPDRIKWINKIKLILFSMIQVLSWGISKNYEEPEREISNSEIRRDWCHQDNREEWMRADQTINTG